MRAHLLPAPTHQREERTAAVHRGERLHINRVVYLFYFNLLFVIYGATNYKVHGEPYRRADELVILIVTISNAINATRFRDGDPPCC